MSEAKHTPGPWNCNRASAAGRDIVVSENQPIDICVLSKRDKTNVEIQANARIIAAAPDLLDALKELVQVSAHLDPCQATVEQARAAIAKATGKKQ